MDISDQAKGIIITVCAVLIVSPDSLIIRLLDLDHWTLLFWRGLFISIAMISFLTIYYRANTVQQFRKIGRSGLILIVFFTGSTLFFVTALTYTSVANALVIVATAPIFATILSRVVLKESISIFTGANDHYCTQRNCSDCI